MAEERLQKVMAAAGVASRRHAEELIAQGRVTVNGEIVREMGVKVDPELDRIEVDGNPLSPESKVYLAVHKPEGVVTTADDPEGRPTILDLVPAELGRVYPVGRLDMDSRGLVLLTNDGDLAHKLMHPSYEHEKEYRVKVAGQPGQTAFNHFRQGVQLEDGVTAPAEIAVLERLRDATWLRVVLHEGRKRQVRRMFDALEHPVRDLLRVRVGPILLGNLPEGDWRRLSVREVQALRRLADGYEVEPITPPMVPNKSLVVDEPVRGKPAKGAARGPQGRTPAAKRAAETPSRPAGRGAGDRPSRETDTRRRGAQDARGVGRGAPDRTARGPEPRGRGSQAERGADRGRGRQDERAGGRGPADRTTREPGGRDRPSQDEPRTGRGAVDRRERDERGGRGERDPRGPGGWGMRPSGPSSRPGGRSGRFEPPTPPPSARPSGPRRPLRDDEDEDDWMEPTDRQRSRTTGETRRATGPRPAGRRDERASDAPPRRGRPVSASGRPGEAPRRGKAAGRPGAAPTRSAGRSGPANRPAKGGARPGKPSGGAGPRPGQRRSKPR